MELRVATDEDIGEVLAVAGRFLFGGSAEEARENLGPLPGG